MLLALRAEGSASIILTLRRPDFDPALHVLVLASKAVSEYEIRGIRQHPRGLACTDPDFAFSRYVIAAGRSAIRLILRLREDGATLVEEWLHVHNTVLAPFVDFSRNIAQQRGEFPRYQRPEPLAVFTHVYNDQAMLRIWERHYAQLVDHRHLYVIDHGSDRPAAEALNPRSNAVRIPRGAVDHANIASFCASFQRFLLSQYQWVIHVDADEMLVHRHGVPALLQSMAAAPRLGIRRVRHAWNIIHDPRVEPALDVHRLVTAQRRFMLPAHTYDKPVLAAHPTSWGAGFHFAMEDRMIAWDDDLWLFHLADIDRDMTLARSRNWNATEITAADAQLRPRHKRPDSEEAVTARLLEKLAPGAEPLPDWVVGRF